MGNINLFVDDEDVDAADAASQWTFEVPPDAVRKGNLKDIADDKARAEWVQRLQIVASKMTEDVTEKDGTKYPCVVAEVQFQVPADAQRKSGEGYGPDPNAGRKMTQWYRIVPSAMKNPQHPKFKANNFAYGKLLGIARSAYGTSVIPRGVKTDLATFFDSPGDGQTPVIVGQSIVANIRQSRYEGKLRDEFTDLIPLELQG